MRLPVEVAGAPGPVRSNYRDFFTARLFVENGHLAAERLQTNTPSGVWVTQIGRDKEYGLQQPILFFLPEHAPDVIAASRNGELWAEVTVPESGLPRPIRLGIKHGESFTPIEAK